MKTVPPLTEFNVYIIFFSQLNFQGRAYQILVQNYSLVLRCVYCRKILVVLVKLSPLKTYLEHLSSETEVLKAKLVWSC